eukprot:6891474-Ditylum_brightwellii.AAC.1
MPTTLNSCAISPEQRQTDTISLLETVSDPILLATINTPQNKAFTFLLDDDDVVVCPQDDNVLQIYILAVLFFSMNGPTSSLSLSWLVTANECDW